MDRRKLTTWCQGCGENLTFHKNVVCPVCWEKEVTKRLGQMKYEGETEYIQALIDYLEAL